MKYSLFRSFSKTIRRKTGSFFYPEKGKKMDFVKAFFKNPGSDPVQVTTRPSRKAMADQVGGAYYQQKIKLSTGKTVELFYYQLAVSKLMDYNFSICPTEDKRTWIDISGPALVVGEDMTDADLTAEELKELFRVPYE